MPSNHSKRLKHLVACAASAVALLAYGAGDTPPPAVPPASASAARPPHVSGAGDLKECSGVVELHEEIIREMEVLALPTSGDEQNAQNAVLLLFSYAKAHRINTRGPYFGVKQGAATNGFVACVQVDRGADGKTPEVDKPFELQTLPAMSGISSVCAVPFEQQDDCISKIESAIKTCGFDQGGIARVEALGESDDAGHPRFRVLVPVTRKTQAPAEPPVTAPPIAPAPVTPPPPAPQGTP